jgi:hypothetical protein
MTSDMFKLAFVDVQKKKEEEDVVKRIKLYLVTSLFSLLLHFFFVFAQV